MRLQTRSVLLLAALISIVGLRSALAQDGPNTVIQPGISVVAENQAGVVAPAPTSPPAQYGSLQQPATPLYEKPFVGSNAPLMETGEWPGLLKGLSVSGFFSNTTGMWVNSSGIQYNKSKNSLATERNWLQLDINYVLNGNNKFFVRWWGVYEPPYPFERNAGLTDTQDFYNQYTLR